MLGFTNDIMLHSTLIDDDIQEAIEKVQIARQNESLADPEFLDIAIERTNIAQRELDLLIKAKKLNKN